MHHALVLALVALSLAGCSSFDEAPAAADGGVDDGSAAKDGGSARDASPGATVKCENTTCDLAAGQVCCLYRTTGSTTRRAECGPRGQCPAPSGGESLEVEASCDEAGDCAPGLVCCHSLKACNVAALVAAQCVKAENCATCSDGGTGRVVCDPTKSDGACPGRCGTLTDVPIATGSCQ